MPAAWVAAAAAVVGAVSSMDSGGGSSANNNANQASSDAAQVGREQWDYYKANYQPLETNLIGQANAAGSPDEFARARGAANADVTGGFDAARKQTKARMESYGINPGSPAYQSTLASTDIAEGATRAGALTAADNNTRNLAYSKALDVVGLGRNIPAQSAASSANAANASTAAGKLAFQRNQENAKNTGYAINSAGNVASKWFTSPSSNTNSGPSEATLNQWQSNVNSGPSESAYYSPETSYAKGGLVAYADGGEVEREDLTKDSWKTDQQPPALERPRLRFAGVGRPRLDIPTGDRNAKLEASVDIGVSHGGLQVKKAGITYRKTFSEGGEVIDAEKTGDGTYDATGLKAVLQKRGLSPAVAHREANGAAARHKGHITPHMRRFAGGGGVGRQGLESAGPDASDMGELQGPGTETSDSIPAEIDGAQPAALSTGEVVMNAEVPKLKGEEILAALNEAGLKKRQQTGIEPQTSSDVAANDGAQAYAEGGEVGNDEQQFQSWYAEHAKKLGLSADADHPEHHYDWRAAYRAGAKPDDAGHWPSVYKKEGHPRMVIDGVNTKTGKPAPTQAYARGGRVSRGAYGLGA